MPPEAKKSPAGHYLPDDREPTPFDDQVVYTDWKGDPKLKRDLTYSDMDALCQFSDRLLTGLQNQAVFLHRIAGTLRACPLCHAPINKYIAAVAFDPERPYRLDDMRPDVDYRCPHCSVRLKWTVPIIGDVHFAVEPTETRERIQRAQAAVSSQTEPVVDVEYVRTFDPDYTGPIIEPMQAWVENAVYLRFAPGDEYVDAVG